MFIKLIVHICGSFWTLYRKCNNAKFPLLRTIYRFLFRADSFVHGSSFAWESYFKGEPCFPHGRLGIFVSKYAQIGKNCVIFQHVTIGYNSLPDSKGKGAPIIGENCYIGAGAKIIGNVKVGDNVRVGANCVVYKDIPDNSIVVSNIQRIIKRQGTLINKFYFKPEKWVYFDDGRWIEETDPKIIKALSS